MIGPEVQILGDKELLAGLTRLENVFSDISPIFEKLGTEFFRQAQQRFNNQGPGWPALTPEYARRKAQIYGSKTILRATDRLYESFKQGGAGSIESIGPQEAEFGSSVPHGVFHQEGTSRMLPRPIIEDTPESLASYQSVAEDAMNEQIRRLGFQVI